MSDVKWIKISTGIFDDEKIKLIEAMPDSDTILVIWIKLLTLAGRVNSRGEIFVSDSLPYTETTLAHVFQRKLNTVKMALKTFENFGMIEILENQKIVITNWAKHQSVDGLEKIRESSRERVRRFRDKEKLLALVDKEESREDIDIEESVTCNVTETLPKRFVVPSLEQCISYAKEIGWIESQVPSWHDHFQSNGWKVGGKAPMKDWKAAMRTAKSRSVANQPKKRELEVV